MTESFAELLEGTICNRQIKQGEILSGTVVDINPDVVISVFTGVNEQININNYYNYLGYSYGPWYNFNYNTSTTQGTLYVDIVDYKKNELVWQGIGKGYISEKTSKKEEQIKSFVNKILLQYPVK